MKTISKYRDEKGKMLKGKDCFHHQIDSCQGHKNNRCGGCIPTDPLIFGKDRNFGLGYNTLYHNEENTMNNSKVYCQQCKYICQHSGNCLGIPVVGEPSNMYCDYNKNIISKSFDTWFQIVRHVEHRQQPCEINKNNDCSWFEFTDIPTGDCVGTKDLNS